MAEIQFKRLKKEEVSSAVHTYCVWCGVLNGGSMWLADKTPVR